MVREITSRTTAVSRVDKQFNLAILTLLVGENGAGKASFLALVQVLLDMTIQRHWWRHAEFQKKPILI